MANDDWRITVEVEGAKDVAGRLGGDLSAEAQGLAEDLKGRRMSVSVDDETLFIYCNSQADAEKALAIVESELRANNLEAKTSTIEHWLDAEERWDDEPPGETWEEEKLEEGYAPWEVRIECASRESAEQLAAQLETEGYKPLRHSHYLIVGAASHEDADALATRLHGEVEAGGEIVLEALSEAQARNPFAIFGGLAQ